MGILDQKPLPSQPLLPRQAISPAFHNASQAVVPRMMTHYTSVAVWHVHDFDRLVVVERIILATLENGRYVESVEVAGREM
jgi:hypothetical protein